MSSLEKARRKLEKAGFTGQTLERAMELLERTNASILAELLVKMVTSQEKRRPWRCTRRRSKCGNWRPNWGSRPRNRPKKEQNEVTGSGQMCLLPVTFVSYPAIEDLHAQPIHGTTRPPIRFFTYI